MPKKELDLFQLSATRVTKLGTGSPEVMRSKMNELHLVGAPPNHIPDDVFGESFAPRRSVAADCSEDPACADVSRTLPAIYSGFHPNGHRDGPNMAAFANQIYDGPVPLPYLQIINFQTG